MGALSVYSVSTDDSIVHQLDDLIIWSSDKIEEEDLRYSFVSSQMHDLELKQREAKRIIDLTTAETAMEKIVKETTGSDRSEELAELQMQMVTRIFGVYGIDCLEGISKTFEKGAGFSALCSWIIEKLLQLISKQDEFNIELLKKGIRLGVPIALTKGIGNLASWASYNYVEAHINGEPVKLEELYSDPNHANFIKLLVSGLVDSIEEKLPQKSENENDSSEVKPSKKQAKEKKDRKANTRSKQSKRKQ